MKISNALATTFLFLSVISYGQKLKLGPEIGFNMPFLESTELGKSFEPCFHAGANVEYHFIDYFYLRSGVFASQKRQSYSSSDTVLVNLFVLEDLIEIDEVNLESYSHTSGRVAQLYIELPLVAAYRYKDLSIYAGPYFGFMLSAKAKEVKSVDTPFLRTVDIVSLIPDGLPVDAVLATLPAAEKTRFNESSSKSGLKPLDIGLKAGLSYQFNNLGANVNYQYGFTDFRTPTQLEFQNHHYFQLTLHYNFGIGKGN